MNKISIIIPFYNTKIEYVKQCLDSVKIQTYQNYECIIVNDCSNEQSSINFIKEYESLNKGFVFISNEKNSGCGMSRETGLKQASGNIIMFLDSDDYLEPNAFSVVNEIFTKYPNLDIFSFNFYKDNNVVEQLYDGFNTNEIIDPNINFNVIKDKQMV
jgi:glycosyltransferase involved in cell wall biosynthesis